MQRLGILAAFLAVGACNFGGPSAAGLDEETGLAPTSESGIVPAPTGSTSPTTSTSDGADSRGSAGGTTSVVAESSGGSDSSGTGETPLPSGPFGAPSLIDEVSDPDAQDDDPSVRFDELEMYFNSNRDTTFSIYVTTRSSVDAPWGSPERNDTLSSAAPDSTPSLSEDGLVITVSSRPFDQYDLFIAYRDSFEDEWSNPVRIDDLNSAANEFHAQFLDDTAYFCRATAPAPSQVFTAPILDLRQLTFGEQSVLSPPTDVEPVCGLTIRRDRLELFVGEGEVDQIQIIRLEREDIDAAWESGVLEPAINADLITEDPWISWDGHRLYFTGREKDGDSIRGIYVAER